MEEELGKIKKNDATDIVIRVDEFGGEPGVTIREFVTSDRYTGFTKAGIRILEEGFSRFKEIINSISEDNFNVKGKIDQIIYNVVKGIKEPTEEEKKIFDAWYEKEFKK